MLPDESVSDFKEIIQETKLAGLYMDSLRSTQHPRITERDIAAVLVNVQGEHFLIHLDQDAWLATPVRENQVCGIVASSDNDIPLGRSIRFAVKNLLKYVVEDCSQAA